MEVGKEKRWLCGLQVVYATAVTKPGHGSMAPLAIGFTLFASAFVGAPSFMEKEVVGITKVGVEPRLGLVSVIVLESPGSSACEHTMSTHGFLTINT